ncbi:MAG: phospholipase D-like domain-containing protein [Candidatus Anstonellales archaeon]
MKSFKYFLGGFGAGIGLVLLIMWMYGPSSIANGAIFSPGEGEQIIYFIEGANETLDIEVYVFTSKDVLEALGRAEERGVRVRVLLERDVAGDSNEQMFSKLEERGVEVRWAETSGVMHSKFIIRDGKDVLVGSHNFTEAALVKNREASVVLSGREVEEFREVFELDWASGSG